MITVTTLSKEYLSQQTHEYWKALDNVSFDVGAGEKVAVLGRNGSGKSTLMRLLADVELPTSGNIERSKSISWPVGLNGAAIGSLTGTTISGSCAAYSKGRLQQSTNMSMILTNLAVCFPNR